MFISAKRAYSPPSLVEFGAVQSLTLGSNGTLPDFDMSGNLINNSCPTETFIGPDGRRYRRVYCVNEITTLS